MLPVKGSASEGSAAFSGDFKGVCVLRGSRWKLTKKTNDKALKKETTTKKTPSQENGFWYVRETSIISYLYLNEKLH